MVDVYKTLEEDSEETLFKEKGSKFFGYAFPVTDEEQVKNILLDIKKKHHAARHWCYAYKLGVDPVRFRVNDDGEPSNSAGQPIYGQILAADVTDVLVVVVRYFGGVKLGVGGLIRAYKASAQLTLETSKIVEKTIEEKLELTFQYQHMNKVMRVIKQKRLTVFSQELTTSCKLILNIKKSEFSQIKNAFEALHFLAAKKL
ncbi:YigZ family protein [Flavicella sp.]|uniref:IMPACT family protein n=1 Tax=Flavicella sp. TaxID=2957742 RepID=UPI002634B19C|nr:YigZ family protein [Flavicella sp.]MDG1806058.1 YigZ family protein [Flavicella sp.]